MNPTLLYIWEGIKFICLMLFIFMLIIYPFVYVQVALSSVPNVSMALQVAGFIVSVIGTVGAFVFIWKVMKK